MSDLLSILTASLAGTYTIERELGRGGMATVFLAEDAKHGRQVAIKVLHPELANSMGAGRFHREIEIAARLQHPHILPLYDSGQAGEFLYYVMPLVEGESLRDRMNREKQLSLEDAIKITVEVAGALAYAHSRGVVHRDIKPENVLLSGGVAVVADFGIARAVTAATDQSLTQTGTVVGTPAYMSPEQAAGSQDIDGRSDQYSLACMLYEMLVGDPPFTGPTALAVMARHSMDAVSPPTIVRGTIPDAVEDALLKALNKIPADRFATTQLFAEAIQVPSAATGPQRRLTGSPARGSVRGPKVPTVSVEVAGRRLSPRMLGLAAAGLVVLAAGAWAVQRFASGGGSLGRATDSHRIAVLYFTDASQEQRLGYLADGLTEALIHELSQVDTLEVISRNGVAPFRDSRVAPDSIARALNVGTLVEGTLDQAGDTLRLRVALVNARSGAEIANTTLRRARADVFALQDDVAQEVSVFLRRRLGEEIQLAERRAETDNAAAWELTQRAQRLRREFEGSVGRGDTTTARRALLQADSLLGTAAGMDRGWATPVIERGWLAFDERKLAGFGRSAADEWTTRGLRFADAAIARSADDPEALRLRGTMRYIRWVVNLDPAPLTSAQLLTAAERDLTAGAVSTNPNRASALALLSHLLLRRSATAEGKLAALQAYEADPYLTEARDVLWRLFASSLDLEDGVEAAKWCQEGHRRFPNDPFFTECQISIYALQDQTPDIPRAWRLLEQNIAQYPPNQREYRRRRGQLLVAMALARAGLADSARAVALRARAGPDVDPVRDLVYVEVLLRNLLGDHDEALSLLRLYLATNPQDRATVAKDATWWWRGLRDDPRFKQLVGSAP